MKIKQSKSGHDVIFKRNPSSFAFAVICPISVCFRVLDGQSAVSTRCRLEAETTVCDRQRIWTITNSQSPKGVSTINTVPNQIHWGAELVDLDWSSISTRDALVVAGGVQHQWARVSTLNPQIWALLQLHRVCLRAILFTDALLQELENIWFSRSVKLRICA